MSRPNTLRRRLPLAPPADRARSISAARSKNAALSQAASAVRAASAMAAGIVITAIGSLCPAAEAASTGWSETFSRLDKDADQRLVLNEFLAQAGSRDILRRDFKLFDFDGNSSLDKSEYAAVHGISSAGRRGEIPDPYRRLVDHAMDAIDQSYDNWNLRPDESVDTRRFVTNYLKSIATDGNASVSGRMLQQADPDGDQLVSRQEAFVFLQQQLGVLGSAEVTIRAGDGRVVDLANFLMTDEDRNGELSKVEFLAGWWDGSDLDNDFAADDRNGDGVISLAEYADPRGDHWKDPVQWFRQADLNLDAELQLDEMRSATLGRRRQLIDSTFAAFDDDQNGNLSLQEYRLSMHASVNYPWSHRPKDSNGDRRISFGEFEFDTADLFRLQRRYFFHRLDRDGDQTLSSDEFSFARPGSSSLVLISADGTETRQLYKLAAGSLDAPSVSPDGRRILFEQTGDHEGALPHVMLLNRDDGLARQLCRGKQPSWSADGSRFVCSRLDDQSFWIHQADGSGGRRVAEGWGATWSPDGKSISFFRDRALWVYDVENESATQLWKPSDDRYQNFWWNMAWSPDSQQLVLRGILQGRSELNVVSLREPEVTTPLLSAKVEMGTGFAWSPDGSRIVFPMRNRRQQRTQLFQISPDGLKGPTAIDEFAVAGEAKSGCFVPGGLWYISVQKD